MLNLKDTKIYLTIKVTHTLENEIRKYFDKVNEA